MNDGPSKIGHDCRNKSFLKLNPSKNVFNKSWCPKLVHILQWKFFLERFGQFLTFKVRFWYFSMNRNSLAELFYFFSFEHVDSWAKTLLVTFTIKKADVILTFFLIGKIRHNFLVPRVIEAGRQTFMPTQTLDLQRYVWLESWVILTKAPS